MVSEMHLSSEVIPSKSFDNAVVHRSLSQRRHLGTPGLAYDILFPDMGMQDLRGTCIWARGVGSSERLQCGILAVPSPLVSILDRHHTCTGGRYFHHGRLLAAFTPRVCSRYSLRMAMSRSRSCSLASSSIPHPLRRGSPLLFFPFPFLLWPSMILLFAGVILCVC